MLGDAFFVSPSVNKRTVQLADGTEHELYFCKVSSYEYNRFLHHLGSKVADDRAEAPHILVAASLCEPNGKPVLTLEKSKSLKPEVLDLLFEKAFEINKKVPAEGNA